MFEEDKINTEKQERQIKKVNSVTKSNLIILALADVLDEIQSNLKICKVNFQLNVKLR